MAISEVFVSQTPEIAIYRLSVGSRSLPWLHPISALPAQGTFASRQKRGGVSRAAGGDQRRATSFVTTCFQIARRFRIDSWERSAPWDYHAERENALGRRTGARVKASRKQTRNSTGNQIAISDSSEQTHER